MILIDKKSMSSPNWEKSCFLSRLLKNIASRYLVVQIRSQLLTQQLAWLRRRLLVS